MDIYRSIPVNESKSVVIFECQVLSGAKHANYTWYGSYERSVQTYAYVHIRELGMTGNFYLWLQGLFLFEPLIYQSNQDADNFTFYLKSSLRS